MEVILMRHSRTAGNLQRRYVGSTDEPLCQEGIELAHRTGIDTETTVIYVSPLKRAYETAEIKFPNAQRIVCSDLREMDFGEFEGRTADEMAHDAAYIKWLESNCMDRCPNGEAITEFTDRVCRAFDTIVKNCFLNGDEKLVVVAHGGTIMSILTQYSNSDRHYYEWYIDNCCGYRATLDGATWAHTPTLTELKLFETLT